MKKRNMHLISKTISVILIMLVIASIISINTYSVAAKEDPVVVVSLGDSYSSGEGIPPFIGQDLKEKSYDWLAHRSTKSWSSQLEIPGVEVTLADYYEQVPGFGGYSDGTVVKSQNPSVCKWYFVASSGAETADICYRKQPKPYDYMILNDFSNPTPKIFKGEVELLPQSDVFGEIDDDIDYVTLSVGGNDVQFQKIVIKVIMSSTFFCPYFFESDDETLKAGSDLYNMFITLWENFDKEPEDQYEKNTRTKIKKTYQQIHREAPNAKIIVAGYPELFYRDCDEVFIARDEAVLVGENVRRFNYELGKIVSECQEEMEIEFVDVADEFDGHNAYSPDPWINPVMILRQEQDLDQSGFISKYSIHPNEEGAKAYARCVNKKLAEVVQKSEEKEKLEEEQRQQEEITRNSGYLKGTVCDASDNSTPITQATINIYKDDKLEKTEKTDSEGNFNIYLYRGNYTLEIKAEGYIDLKCEAKVTKEETNDLGAITLVKGSANQSGSIKGYVKIKNVPEGFVGSGWSKDISIDIYKGWSNSDDDGNHFATIKTSNGGAYSLLTKMPCGYYTAVASKKGYYSTTFNFTVQYGINTIPDVWISSAMIGKDYTVTLTWEDPSYDMDLCMHGVKLDKSGFFIGEHASDGYTRVTSVKDGNVEVCSLEEGYSDVRQEQITITPTTIGPYDFYVCSPDCFMDECHAKVTVSYHGQPLYTYDLEDAKKKFHFEDYQVWNVFSFDDGDFIEKNNISATPRGKNWFLVSPYVH